MARTNHVADPFAFNWKVAIWAGLIAGAVFMIMEMTLVALAGGESPWAPPRMIAAIVLGENVLPPPATFDIGIMTTALIVHFALSIVYAVLFAWVVSRWQMSRGVAIVLGAGFGLALYLINFYPIAAALFPWFAMARNWISILSHIVFGAVLAWSYIQMARRQRPDERQKRMTPA
jgi:uncharacterized membrane protein YagU involved in acid resistance